jgi:hypothetical protein
MPTVLLPVPHFEQSQYGYCLPGSGFLTVSDCGKFSVYANELSRGKATAPHLLGQ